MKKLKFLLLACIFLGSNAIAQSYSKNVRCEASATRALTRNHEVCSAIKDIVASHRCMGDMWQTYGKSTCSNYGRSSAANQIFINNRMISNFEDYLSGKINDDLMRQQNKKLFQMFKEEFERMDRFVDGELDDMEQSLSTRRSFNFFESAIRMLGGSVGGVYNSSNFTTYILNGRVINCSTVGAFINCN